MMIDFHCFPIVERIVMIENGPWASRFVELRVKEICPTVYSYVHNFRSLPTFKSSIIDFNSYSKHLIRIASKPMGVKAQLSVEVYE